VIKFRNSEMWPQRYGFFCLVMLIALSLPQLNNTNFASKHEKESLDGQRHRPCSRLDDRLQIQSEVNAVALRAG
jgi:hypothetical protein